MRSDYALYTVSIIFFILTGIIYGSMSILADVERHVGVVATVIFGLLFIGLGYSQRPKLKTESEKLPSATPAVTEAIKKEAPVEVEVTPSTLELTHVRGIGEKRAEQLKIIGIKDVKDLAKTSVKDLATKLEVSPKITRRWVSSAKKLVKESYTT